MKSRYFVGLLSASMLLLFSASATAQNAWSANAGKYKIAVVDISYIFKQHARFNQQIEAMKKRMEALDKTFASERQAIADKEKERNAFKPNTQQWKNLDVQVTKAKADFTVKADQQQKALMQEEADIYFRTYLEVRDAIKQYALRADIGLVLRFNGNEVDPGVRQDIIRGINRPVVYQNSIDITPDILQVLNRSVNTTQPPTDTASLGNRIPPRQ